MRQRTHDKRAERQRRRHIGGVITVVQEDRFGLLADDGVHLLCQLAHGCPAGWSDLQRLMHERMHVDIDCDDPKGVLITRVHHVFRSDEQSGRVTS